MLQATCLQVTHFDNAAVSLSNLAQHVRDEHAAFTQTVSDAAGHAINCGRALIAAQQLVPKGQWTSWVRKHCEIGERHVRRYIALVRAFDASGHGESGDLVGLSLNGMIRKLTPPAKRQQRPVRHCPKPAAHQQSLLDCTLTWAGAPPAERTRFVDGIGWRALAEAIPASWYPAIEKWMDDRRRPTAPPVAPRGDSLALPADLSIPAFLQRSNRSVP
jgi:Protein of unknown function (DUF3102)